jgi:hypothetical protein
MLIGSEAWGWYSCASILRHRPADTEVSPWSSIEERLTWPVQAVPMGGGGHYGHLLPDDRDVASAVRELRLTFSRSCPPLFKSGNVEDQTIDHSKQAISLACLHRVKPGRSTATSAGPKRSTPRRTRSWCATRTGGSATRPPSWTSSPWPSP